MNYFILTTKDSFESDKQWILDNTCLELDGMDCPSEYFNRYFYGFEIKNNTLIWIRIYTDDDTRTPILLNDKTKQELKQKYGAKTWTANGIYNIKAPTIEAAIASARKAFATITSVVQK